MLKKFRRQYPPVQAFQLTRESLENRATWPKWLHKRVDRPVGTRWNLTWQVTDGVLRVWYHNLTRNVELPPNSWLIKGSADAHVFAMTDKKLRATHVMVEEKANGLR